MQKSKKIKICIEFDPEADDYALALARAIHDVRTSCEEAKEIMNAWCWDTIHGNLQKKREKWCNQILHEMGIYDKDDPTCPTLPENDIPTDIQEYVKTFFYADAANVLERCEHPFAKTYRTAIKFTKEPTTKRFGEFMREYATYLDVI